MLAAALNAKRMPRTGWTPNPIPIITASATSDLHWVFEPTVIYEGGIWKLWYTAANSLNTISCFNYATCTGDPTVAANWTKYASNPVIGSTSSGFHEGGMFLKVGSTYYAYWYDTGGGGNIVVATSSDGITWGTSATALSTSAASWVGSWTNVFVWNEGGTAWKMLATGHPSGGTSTVTISYATSTDGLSWTVVGTGPVSGLTSGPGASAGSGGPWIAANGKINGRYQLWVHASNLAGWSAIYHASSADAQNWTLDATNAEVPAPSNGTVGTSSTIQQSADPCVVEVNDISYLFYTGADNVAPAASIYVATYPGAIKNLTLWI